MKRLTDEQRAERTERYLAKQQANAAAVIERRRARYAGEIAHLESLIRHYSETEKEDARTDRFYVSVPSWRAVLVERRTRAQERLNWLYKRCGLDTPEHEQARALEPVYDLIREIAERIRREQREAGQ